MASAQPVKENPDDVQEEERLEDAMEHLKMLHLQLKHLRTAIPRAIQPLCSKQPSPDALFSSFAKSVGETSSELNDFKAAMTSEESKKVFEKANESRQVNPKGIRTWRATEDPEWTTSQR